MHTHVCTPHIYTVKNSNMSSSESDTSKTEINDVEDLNIISHKLNLVHTQNSVSY